jgi:hypothetical protein
MAAPAFVNAGSFGGQSANTTVTLPLPASRVNGNLLLAVVSFGQADKVPTLSWPSGWTPLISLTGIDAFASSAVAYRVVNGSEVNVVLTWTGLTDVEGRIFQYSGVFSSSPIGATHATRNAGASTSVSEAGVTVQRNNSLVAVILAGGQSTETWNSGPSGYTTDAAWTQVGVGGAAEYSQTTPSVAGNASTAVSITMNSAHRYSCYSIEVTSESANTAPVVSTSAAITYLDRDPATAIATDLTVTDADSANMASAVVSITGNFSSSQDVLGFTNQNGITGSYNSGTGVLTLSGSATKANYQTALRSVTYQNTSHSPTNNTRTISFKVNDGSADSPTDTATVTVVTVTGGVDEFSASGAQSWVVESYHALEIELWAGGSSGDCIGPGTYHAIIDMIVTTAIRGNVGGTTSISSLSLSAAPAALSTGQFPANALAGVPGTGSGGDTNLPGTRGGAGGVERLFASIPASPDQGGNAPFGGFGGSGHPAGGGSGQISGFDGYWPGGGGGATRTVGFGFGGWKATHPAGGTSGSYVKKRYVRGDVGAPAVGSTLSFTVGAGGAAVTSSLGATSGAGANGGVRFRTLPFSDLTPGEGGDTPPSPPVDLGTGTVTITGDLKAGSVLTATYDGDDPDSSTGFATGLAYQWYRSGVAITGATGETYKLTADDIGETISASIAYTDAKGFRDTALSDETDTIAPKPRPLDYFISGEPWAAYGLRLLRSDYTGPLFRLQHGAITATLLDVYPEADGEVDWDAIEAWRVAHGTEFDATRFDTWYNQMDNVSRARDLKGHLVSTNNMPEYATQGKLPSVLPNGRVAILFNGFEEFRINGIAGPATNLGFLAVVQRHSGLPGYILLWNHPGTEDTTNAGFQIAPTTTQDWQADNAVFFGHGYLVGRGPRAIAIPTEETTNADDAVIWDGEISATRVGIRKNGDTQTLLINDHSSYTQPPATHDLLVGPKTFVTNKRALMAELVIFGTDVRGAVQNYRTDAADTFLLGSVGNPTTDDLSVDFSDDDGLNAVVTITVSFRVDFTDEDGLTATIDVVPAKIARFADEDGLDATVTITVQDRPPSSQLFVICIGT